MYKLHQNLEAFVRVQLPLGIMAAEHDEHMQRRGLFFKESAGLSGRSCSVGSKIWYADYLNGSNLIKTWLHLQNII